MCTSPVTSSTGTLWQSCQSYLPSKDSITALWQKAAPYLATFASWLKEHSGAAYALLREKSPHFLVSAFDTCIKYHTEILITAAVTSPMLIILGILIYINKSSKPRQLPA